jgi:biotin carboxyl carrier protein
MKYFVTLPSGTEHVVEIVEAAGGVLQVTVDGQPVEADAVGQPSTSRSGRGASSIRVGGRIIELWLEGTPPALGVIANGERFFATVESERMRIQAAAKPSAAGEGTVRSPMPGRVVRVLVKEGDDVELGQAVAVVEAMKMENELIAERAGKVKRVIVSAGATVEGGAALIEIGDA